MHVWGGVCGRQDEVASRPAKVRGLALCECISRSVASDSLRPHGLTYQAPLSMKFSR